MMRSFLHSSVFSRTFFRLPSRSKILPRNGVVFLTQNFHATTKREDEVATPAPETPPAASSWDPIYSVPLGIAFAVPAINYEWYLVNEETQLAACFIAFTAIVYKQFGGTIYDMLEEDGKRIVEEHNKAEDQILSILKEKHDDVVGQATIVQDAKDIMALKVATYEKLNAAGQIKPKHDFKAQIEKILAVLQAEEASSVEKAKVALMEEATAAVTQKLLSTKSLQKACLDDAIKKLKGSGGGADPVKATYLDFFKSKAAEAKKVDEKAELAANRASIITKMNAVAANEGFFFEFDSSGKPKMLA